MESISQTHENEEFVGLHIDFFMIKDFEGKSLKIK